MTLKKDSYIIILVDYIVKIYEKGTNMKERVYKIQVLFLFIILAVVLLLFFVPEIKNVPASDVGNLLEWTCIHQDGSQENITLPKKLYQKGETEVEISTVLPDEFVIKRTICFWSYYQAIEVYLDQGLVYFFDNSEIDSFGKASTSKWNYIEIPSGSDGKILTIRMHTPYTMYHLRMDDIVYGSTAQIQTWLYQKYRGFEFIDMAVICLGVVFFFWILFLHVDKRYRLYQMYFSITILCLGLWFRFGVKGVPVYGLSNYTKDFIGYLAFVLLPIPFTAYIKNRVQRTRVLYVISKVLIVLESISMVVVFLLHGLGIRDIQENIALSQFMLLCSVLLAFVSALYYYIKERHRISITTVLSAGLLLISLYIEYFYLYHSTMNLMELGVTARGCLLVVVVVESITCIKNMRKIARHQKEIEEENKNLQLHILTSQIRPHFILNTLGAIRMMIHKDADQAYDLLYDFSKYIRKNMEEKDYSKLIPFLEELDYIETYLKLEKLRFGERLNVEYDIQFREFLILPLTIQPFVENAVKHGLFQMNQGGTIWIRTRKTEKGVIIEICDNGIGFDMKRYPEILKNGKSVGMRSAILRLEREMGGKCTVTSRTGVENSGTCIKIELTGRGVVR